MLLLERSDAQETGPQRSVAGFAYDPHPNRTETSYCYFNGQIVASILKRENHNSRNDGVYEVTVLNAKMEQPFRYIEEARRAARAEYLSRVNA